MKNRLIMKYLWAAALFAIVVMTSAGAAFAAESTVKLNIPMWCVSCPYMVQRVLENVEGVAGVAVSYEDQSATVTFDDQRTTVAALTEATAEIGFPATLAAE